MRDAVEAAMVDAALNITAEQVQTVASTYFTKENRLVLTIMPSGGPR